MKITKSSSNPRYCHEFIVPEDAVDQNGHVNNVVYVQWMQDVATLHFDAIGGTRAQQKAGAAWVVRSHKITYLKPAFAGEAVTAQTWVSNFRRALSLRCYRFLRKCDDTLLAEAQTDWVLVDVKRGRPMKIPDEIRTLLSIADNNKQPQRFIQIP